MEIKRAIRADNLAFIACFSGHSQLRISSYQNEELILAVEQMRLRRTGQAWLIPVRFTDCDVPDLDLGGGRTLDSLQRVDLFRGSWERGSARLVAAVLSILHGSGENLFLRPDHPPKAAHSAVNMKPPESSGVAAEPPDHDKRMASAVPRARLQLLPLQEEFRRISGALRDSLVRNPEEGPMGWPHDLRHGSELVAVLSTAYGLRAVLLLEGFLPHELLPAAAHVVSRSSLLGGGYAARSQAQPRPEVTAGVLETLHIIDGTADYDRLVASIKRQVDAFVRSRPVIIAMMLEASAQIGYDSELTCSLIRDLLAARNAYGSLLLWPEKTEPGPAFPAPSVVHTARAVRALARAHGTWFTIRNPDALDTEAWEAAQQAAAWLAEQQDLENASEIISRQLPDGVEPLYVRHFTAAWVVKALVSVGLPASHPSVSRAVDRIWNYYNTNAALWSWGNGDLPIWMTLDAVDALRMAALTSAFRSE
jgi:hypothetical protein